MPQVQGSMLLAVAVLVGLLTGGILGAQPSVNGHLGRNVQHPLQAALISFATGTTVVLVISVVAGAFPPRLVVPVSSLPWWAWSGGAMGVLVVSTSLFFVPRVGSLPWFAALMTGQVVTALLLDHFGWLANPRSGVSPARLIGAALMVLGVLAIVYAKKNESPSGATPSPHLESMGVSDESASLPR